MNWFTAGVVFIIAWWLILLALLPVGVRGQHEDYTPLDGTDPGAPQETGLKKKMIWTTCGAAAVTLVGYVIAISGIIQPPQIQW
ncbi:MAG: hypothetical protein CMK09_13510 [Ponticaulis sp.]|nr:hypothetical protein [Ponticaulis sp.]|tara:strand:- start:66352 stop:66603 length:252 start_codon:yes stop_codon:yes gene_type:complete